ncbi:hypothetical protein P7K49_017014 [Saguinus oedipus]|uniref:Uncharacterized protein n=1 Tax=Saguinus oedipus TaxID=9490 RepID=A0ABQ9V196_SAGOE|nr:hypothetical protein P7K49_017014 [Saguinus oedipus]
MEAADFPRRAKIVPKTGELCVLSCNTHRPKCIKSQLMLKSGFLLELLRYCQDDLRFLLLFV